MGFIEKYTEDKKKSPAKLSFVQKEVLWILGLIVYYLTLSTINNQGFVANRYQFLHYQPNLVASFGIALGLIGIFVVSMVISCFYIIILIIVRKNKKHKQIVYHLFFYTVLGFSIWVIIVGFAPYGWASNLFGYLDSLFFWSPTIITDLILFFITVLIDMTYSYIFKK